MYFFIFEESLSLIFNKLFLGRQLAPQGDVGTTVILVINIFILSS